MNITLKALEKLKYLNNYHNVLRIAISGGGCSGLKYVMTWEPSISPDSKDKTTVYDINTNTPLTVIIDTKSSLFLENITLDYSDELNDGGFKWVNPGATHCGCGQSFR